MKNQLLSIENLRMTSRDIAEYCDARHDNVLKTIQRLLKGGVLHCSNPKKYISSTGRQSIEYECDRTDSIVIVARIDPQFMRAIVERWQYLEIQVKQLQEKSQIRQNMKGDFKLMNNSLKEARQLIGKETKHYHYSTESDLLYLIVLGKRSRDLDIEGDLRDNLTLEQTQAIERLQKANTVFLDAGMGYDERKSKLTEMYNKFYSHKKLLH